MAGLIPLEIGNTDPTRLQDEVYTPYAFREIVQAIRELQTRREQVDRIIQEPSEVASGSTFAAEGFDIDVSVLPTAWLSPSTASDMQASVAGDGNDRYAIRIQHYSPFSGGGQWDACFTVVIKTDRDAGTWDGVSSMVLVGEFSSSTNFTGSANREETGILFGDGSSTESYLTLAVPTFSVQLRMRISSPTSLPEVIQVGGTGVPGSDNIMLLDYTHTKEQTDG
jgi:hypothetical protein